MIVERPREDDGLRGDETATFYPDDSGPHPVGEGFPDFDDLTDRELGQYRLGQVIGRGSMARVYGAEHLTLKRPCAIKVLSPGLVERQPQVREQFWGEARVVANLVHPHVVTVHNLGSDRGYHFIEMEYVHGGRSLREVLVKDGPLESVMATRLMLQVSQALGAAHRSGLVHRDVKPANVLLNESGHAKLADFGLVRCLKASVCKGSPLAGTPTFMAPELFDGVPATPQSDFYALGITYFYLLSARLPFASDQMSRLIQLHRAGDIPDVRDLVPETSTEVAQIINRCLAKRPEDRYESAGELVENLRSTIILLRETECLVNESISGLECFLSGARDHFRILFRLPNERLQEVYVEVHTNRHGERLLSIFSVCCPAEAKYHEFALRLNAEMTHGGLSVRNVNGQAMFVMSRSYLRAHVDPADIRAALLEISRKSDWVEQQLTQGDVY